MSALADVFAAVRLQLDGTGFEAQATALADKQGKNVGERMSANLNATLKKAAGGLVGAGAGLAMAAFTQDALALDAATQRLAADAGLTADEAKAAGKAMAGLYKDNLQGFEEIGATLAKVHTDLGLAGDAATQATDLFLKFATATGQNAAEAVSSFDDILDSWGLTAADAQKTMDKLIVSHQRFGGTLTETQRSLALLAAPMRAANFAIDDGIALLGLFGSKGLDAQQGAAAFAKALTKVKSPAELQQLIVDISNTKDPFDRAAKAADLFGAKAGAKLANALGGVNLDDYAISMDDAAGATDRAAAAIEDGFGNRAKMAFRQLSGTLAEFGTSLDAVMMTAALLGPSLTKGLFAAVGGIAGVLGPMLVTQVSAAWAAVQGSSAVQAAAGSAGLASAAAFAAGIAGAGVFQWLGDRVRDGWAGLGGVDFSLAPSLEEQIKRDAARVQAEAGTTGGTAFVDGYTSVLAAATPELKVAGAKAGGSVLDGYMTQQLAIVKAANQTVADVKQAIIDGKAGIVSAWRAALDERNTAANAADQRIINLAEIAAAAKVLVDKKATAAEKAEARIRIRNLRSSNLELLEEQTRTGTKQQQIASTKALLTSKAMDKGLKDKDPEIRQHWIDMKGVLTKQLGQLEGKGEGYGEDFGQGLSAGLRSQISSVARAAEALWNSIVSAGHEGHRAFGGPVVAGRSYVVGERQPELFVPTTNGFILPDVPSGRIGTGPSSSTGSLSGTPLTFVYAPTYSSASPGEAARFANDVAPAITRWQQGRRLIGAG